MFDTSQENLYQIVSNYVTASDKDALTDILMSAAGDTESAEKILKQVNTHDKDYKCLKSGDIVELDSQLYVIMYISAYHIWKRNADDNDWRFAKAGITLAPIKLKKGHTYKLKNEDEIQIELDCISEQKCDCIVQDDAAGFCSDAFKKLTKQEDLKVTDGIKEEIAHREDKILERGMELIRTAAHSAYHAMEIMKETQAGEDTYKALVRIEHVTRTLIRSLSELRELMESYMLAQYRRNLK